MATFKYLPTIEKPVWAEKMGFKDVHNEADSAARLQSDTVGGMWFNLWVWQKNPEDRAFGDVGRFVLEVETATSEPETLWDIDNEDEAEARLSALLTGLGIRRDL